MPPETSGAEDCVEWSPPSPRRPNNCKRSPTISVIQFLLHAFFVVITARLNEMKGMNEDGWLKRGFRITGRVQGVYYRAWTRGVANELGLRGTVRNRKDGTVEVQVMGTPGAVTDFEARLWEGPTSASVEGVEPVESPGAVPPGSFQILPTA